WAVLEAPMDFTFQPPFLAGLSGYVAELGAAFLCADLGLALEDRADHAAYIGHWLSVLKDDKRAVFTAAAHAQRAADYLHGLARPAEAAA
ncbi:zincin-like metallopeptidase domain-containing protein, partial [Rhizorhapis sp. SPR117]|uniref:zincin-like metallopeptidase domain-containing protein n=1 Tax=Rhizorhapis sp. SPR117 TaxID=2912611 RepID=UPI0030C8370D